MDKSKINTQNDWENELNKLIDFHPDGEESFEEWDCDPEAVRVLIRKFLADARREVIEKVEKLHKNSESASSEHQCSQEGYEYGLDDVLATLKEGK